MATSKQEQEMKRIVFIAFLVAVTAVSLWLAATVAQSGDAAGAMIITVTMTVLITSLATSPLEKRREKVEEVEKAQVAPPARRLGKQTNRGRPTKKRG